MLDDIKIVLRFSNNALDEDILDSIDAARQDLILSGISVTKAKDDTDPLIKRAIKTYCKAEYAVDEKEAKRHSLSYDLLKNHLSMAGDYTM